MKYFQQTSNRLLAILALFFMFFSYGFRHIDDAIFWSLVEIIFVLRIKFEI